MLFMNRVHFSHVILNTRVATNRSFVHCLGGVFLFGKMVKAQMKDYKGFGSYGAFFL